MIYNEEVAPRTLLSKKEKSEARKQHNAKWKQGIKLLSNAANNDDVDLDDPNPRHSFYYRLQLASLFCSKGKEKEEEEWAKFQRTLALPLPVTFRAGGSCPMVVWRAMQRLMSPTGPFFESRGRFVEVNGNVLREGIVRRVNWLDSNHSASQHTIVYQLAVDAFTLAHTDGLSPLSTYLRREVRLGFCVRQELASMIPACLLDLQPHHCVLDVCAAPGSKTEQILAIMSRLAGPEGPSGMVVANDADTKRILTLRQRYSRACVPHMLLVNSRAEALQTHIARTTRQNIRTCLKNQQLTHSTAVNRNNPMTAQQILDELGPGQFDRIVADVPCSGDGTVRKFPHIWRLFRPRIALELHHIQLQIAIAAVLMLKPGGRLVYSTCSLNPLEDEAVVCGLLRYFNVQGKYITNLNKKSSFTEDSAIGGGVCRYQTQYGNHLQPTKNYSLRLINAVPQILPQLHARVGLESWQCNTDTFVDRRAEADDITYKESLQRLPSVRASMKPPTEQERPQMNLQYCRRVMPQDMDSGGFFVAVLEWLEIPLTEGYGIPFIEGTISGTSATMENVSAAASVEVMSQLGYNPAVVGVSNNTGHKRARDHDHNQSHGTKLKKSNPIKSDETKNAFEAAEGLLADPKTRLQFNAVEPNELQALSKALSLNLQKDINCNNPATMLIKSIITVPDIDRTTKMRNVGAVFGSRANGWQLKHPTSEPSIDSNIRSTYNVVSQSVWTALNTWAKPLRKPFDPTVGDGAASNDVLVLHAGLPLALNTGSMPQQVQLLPSAVNMISPFLSPTLKIVGPPKLPHDTPSPTSQSLTAMEPPILSLNADDFSQLCKLGMVGSSSGSGQGSDEHDEGGSAAVGLWPWSDDALEVPEAGIRNAALQTAFEGLTVLAKQLKTSKADAARLGDIDFKTDFAFSQSGQQAWQMWVHQAQQLSDMERKSWKYLYVQLQPMESSPSNSTLCNGSHSKDSMQVQNGVNAANSTYGRRMSKAEKKRLKVSSGTTTTVSQNTSGNSSIVEATALPNAPDIGGPAILVIQYRASPKEYRWVSSSDICESFAAALS